MCNQITTHSVQNASGKPLENDLQFPVVNQKWLAYLATTCSNLPFGIRFFDVGSRCCFFFPLKLFPLHHIRGTTLANSMATDGASKRNKALCHQENPRKWFTRMNRNNARRRKCNENLICYNISGIRFAHIANEIHFLFRKHINVLRSQQFTSQSREKRIKKRFANKKPSTHF